MSIVTLRLIFLNPVTYEVLYYYNLITIHNHCYFSMQELCFTQAIKGQACKAREVHSQSTNNIWNVNCLVAVSLHKDCFFLLTLRWKWYHRYHFQDMVYLKTWSTSSSIVANTESLLLVLYIHNYMEPADIGKHSEHSKWPPPLLVRFIKAIDRAV